MTEDSKRGISRRSIVKASAWTTPVVLVAAAAPAHAAVSPGCLDVKATYVEHVDWGGFSNNKIQFEFTVRDGCSVPIGSMTREDIRFTNGNREFTKNWVIIGGGGLPQAARVLTQSWSFTVVVDVWNQFVSPPYRPNLATLTYTVDGVIETISIPVP